MKYLLTSEGLSTPAIRDEFLKLVAKEPEDVKVAFIPIAAETEEDTSWINYSKAPLLDMGVTTIDDIDLKEIQNEDLYDTLKQYDVVWVNGGNTFFLLYWVQLSGFDMVMERLLDEGTVYVGLSAGTVLACPTIEVAGWKGVDDPQVVNLDTYKSLHLVDYYIFVHYQEKWKAIVEEHRNKLDRKLICLTDTQAISSLSGVI